MHTPNGTAVTTRVLLAVMESFQGRTALRGSEVLARYGAPRRASVSA